MIRLVDLTEPMCKWPINSDDAPYEFCGQDRAAGVPYCIEHARIAYPKSYVPRVTQKAYAHAAGKAELAAIVRSEAAA